MALQFPKTLSLSAPVEDSNGNMSTDRLEIKSGHLKLVCLTGTKERRMDAFVRVYRSSFEHYAVVFQNKTFCKASAYLNLKSCVVSADIRTNKISIRPDNAEGMGVVLLETDEYSVGEWLAALSLNTTLKKGLMSPKLSPVIPRSPVMQPLLENEEDDTDL